MMRRLIPMLAFFSLALAHHGPQESQLAGTPLCLDPSSVQVVFEMRGRLPQNLDGLLLDELANVFTSYQVPLERTPACANSKSFTLVQVFARYLDPEIYLNFPAESYSYSLAIQVGDYQEISRLGMEEALPEALYLSFVSSLYSEVEAGEPIEDHLLALGKVQIRELAKAWWVDNAEVQMSTWKAPRVLGTSLAILAAAAVFLSARIRRSWLS